MGLTAEREEPEVDGPSPDLKTVMSSTVGLRSVTVYPSQIVDLNAFSERFSAREKILIVDHRPIFRQSLVEELSNEYQCTEAKSAIEAFSLLKHESFSVVIAENMLPGLSGIELMRSVVQNHPGTAVIVMSDVDRPQRALDAVRLGAFDYLIRPFEPVVLRMTIERAIERRRLMLDAQRYKRDLEQRNLELEEGKREMQRLQAQIVHSEKMASLGQLAAGVAHELNNPVGFVYGNLELLRERLEGLAGLLRYYDYTPLEPMAAIEVDRLKREISYDDTKQDMDLMIKDCLEGATRIRDIVQNLRTFSRLDEAELKRINIHEGIESTLRILSKYFSADNIELVREFRELPEVEAFAGQLNQVWMNLLVNAAQAVSVTGGQVTIATSSDGDNIKVAISDTGPGIPDCIRDKIFDPFFTTKPVGEGAGLGLSITFGIIERHSGKIEVDSRPGCGTTFTVTIPVKAIRDTVADTQLQGAFEDELQNSYR
jgi:two-component system NtrC family sensor kinase